MKRAAFALLLSLSACRESAPTPEASPAPAADAAPAPTPDTVPTPMPDTTPAPSADVAPAADTAATDAAPLFLSGKIELPQGLALRLLVAREGGAVTLDIPDQALRGAPITDLVFSEEALSFTFLPPGAPEQARGRFQATRKGEAWEGTLVQAGMTLPTRFERVASRQAFARRRPQTPLPPFPFYAEDVTVPVDGGALACTLVTPMGPWPFGAVLLLSGSGAQDRDETLFDHKPFFLLADALAEAGVASLRCDDRGVGGSPAHRPGDDLAVFAADARALLDFLATRAELRKDRIGVLGHSEGAVVVSTLLASERPPAFAVTIGGPALPGHRVLVRQNLELGAGAGLADAELARFTKAIEGYYAAIVGDAPDEALEAAALELATVTELVQKARGAPSEAAEVAAKRFVELAKEPWLRSFAKSDPGPALAASPCPLLAVYGERDTQVPLEHAQALRDRLAAAPNPRVRVEVLPGLNHLLQTARSGTIAEYAELEETMSPKARDALVAFVKAESSR